MTMYIYKFRDYQSEYSALVNAIHRCHNKRHKAYYNYGARGIYVCDEWRMKGEFDSLARAGFQNFMSHIGPKPSQEYTLERIDNNIGYEPNNVKWATRSEQQKNRREVYPTGFIRENWSYESIERHRLAVIESNRRRKKKAA